jgi:chromosome segregation ATPase
MMDQRSENDQANTSHNTATNTQAHREQNAQGTQTSPAQNQGQAQPKPWRTALANMFSKQSLAKVLDKLKLENIKSLPAAMRNEPGLTAVIVAASLLVCMNVYGLVTFVNVRNEKQAWQAAAENNAIQRQALLDDITALDHKKTTQQEQLYTFKGQLEDEAAQLASVSAKLVAAQTRLETTLQKQTTAANATQRIVEDNEALKHRVFTLNNNLDETSQAFTALKAQRDTLAKEVKAAETLLATHEAKVKDAIAHATKLETKAQAALASIQTKRETLLKLQSEVDIANNTAAKANAQRDAADTRLKAVLLRVTEAQQQVDTLTKAHTTLTATLTKDKSLAADMSKTKAALTAELNALNESRDSIAADLAKKQGQASATKSLIEAAALEHTAVKSRISTIKAELTPLENRRLSVEAAIAGSKKELETLTQQLDALNKAIDKAKARKTSASTAKLPAPEKATASRTQKTVSTK